MAQVAVHIVTYNNEDTITACVQALLAQDADFSVTVWDNASSDGTVACVQALGVPVIAHGENLGYAAAHNHLIERSDAPYILTLNPDVVLQAGFIAAMVRAMEARPGAGSASARLLRVESLHAAPYAIDSLGLYMRRSRRQGLRGDGLPPETELDPQPMMGPDGAAGFYRRAMLDDIRVEGEVFDADFFMHKEDVDVCWRALLRGWGAIYVAEAIGHHVRTFRPGERGRVNERMRFLGVRNRYLLLLKNELPGGWWQDWPFILAYDAGVLGYILLRERASLRALASAWGLRGRMLAKRRQIMAGRKLDWRAVCRVFRG